MVRWLRHITEQVLQANNGMQLPLPRYLIVFLFLFALVSVTACDNDSRNKKLESYIESVKSRSPAPIEPVPKIEPLSKYTYPKVNRRNPFKPFEVKSDQSNVSGPDMNREKEQLEEFPMDSLRMVGILREGNKIWGIISAPDGAAYRVKVGNYMGKNYGRVVSVSDKEIKLIETVRISGRWEKRPVELSLETEE